MGDFAEHAVPFVGLMVTHLGVEGHGDEVDPEVQLAAVDALAKLGMLGVEAAPYLAKRLLGRVSTDEPGSKPEDFLT
eukprot:g9742.t1